MSLHQFAAAKAAATEAIKINPYNAMVHGALVDALVELGEYKAATAAADKMISIRPEYGLIPG
jgi:tetratricopeptide (TPR) repeat protein